MPKFRLFGLLLLVSFLVSGCGATRSIENLGIVLALGLDKGEKMHHSVTVSLPVFEKDSPQKSIQLTAEGKSVQDALTSITENTNKFLVEGQIRTIVLGESLAREGLKEHLDIVTRDSDFPLSTAIIVSKNKVKDFLTPKNPDAIRLGIYLREMVDTVVNQGYLMPADLNTFYVKINADGWDPCLPYYEQTEHGFKFLGRALFEDTKMVGFLNEEEAKIQAVLDGKVAQTPLNFDDPFEADTAQADKRYVSVTVNSATNKVRTSMENGQVKVIIELALEIGIIDKESTLNLLNQKIYDKYEESFARQFTIQAEKLVAKLQSHRTDQLGIGAYFRMQNYDTWEAMGGEKAWRDYWMAADVQVNTEVNIRRFGVISR